MLGFLPDYAGNRRIGPWSYGRGFAFSNSLSVGMNDPAKKTHHAAPTKAAAAVSDRAAPEPCHLELEAAVLV